MARSVFYYHLKRMNKSDKYEEEKAQIRKIFNDNHQRYGYRRVTIELRKKPGFENANHKTVKKLMDEMGLKCVIRRRKYNSYKGEVGKTAPNLINRDFKADKPMKKLATDVTQINVGDEKCYLSPIMDMYNGEILSFIISDSPNLKMVMNMLELLYSKHKHFKNTILHSDQGWHYQHFDFRNSLIEHNINQSMSRKGNCLDNSMMENFFGLMKSELLYNQKFDSMKEFKEKLVEYINYYNNDRIKLRLNGMSPVQYRLHFANTKN